MTTPLISFLLLNSEHLLQKFMLKLIYSCRIRVWKCFISSVVDIVSLHGEHVVHAACIISVVTGKKLPGRQDDDVTCLREMYCRLDCSGSGCGPVVGC
jgi:hypothetical protein